MIINQTTTRKQNIKIKRSPPPPPLHHRHLRHHSHSQQPTVQLPPTTIPLTPKTTSHLYLAPFNSVPKPTT
ncbi:hypothetical protein Hanom_Chr05g00447921 [Helianthus anomalus]